MMPFKTNCQTVAKAIEKLSMTNIAVVSVKSFVEGNNKYSTVLRVEEKAQEITDCPSCSAQISSKNSSVQATNLQVECTNL